MKALPWIILIVVVLAVVYYLYNQKKKAAAGFTPPAPEVPNTATPPTATLGTRPVTNTNQNVAPSSTAEVPPVVSGASLTSASCLNTPPVVGLIKAFKESKPIQFVQRLQIKDTMGAICPEGLRYLVR